MTSRRLMLLAAVLLPVAAAYVQWAVFGLPRVSVIPEATTPHGFPAWLRITHYVNFLFFVLLVRSGLQILLDHPRLYWNVHCTPGTEWLRFTPIDVHPSSSCPTSRWSSFWPPLAILTGPSMSPALTSRFAWYPMLPGNRQIGRSLHFLIMCAFVAFLIGHVTMVVLTGLTRNMNADFRGRKFVNHFTDVGGVF